MLRLKSSNLSAVDYDDSTAILTVVFVKGPAYEYYGVSPIMYKNLMSARSKGAYFDVHIKKRGCRYRRIM